MSDIIVERPHMTAKFRSCPRDIPFSRRGERESSCTPFELNKSSHMPPAPAEVRPQTEALVGADATSPDREAAQGERSKAKARSSFKFSGHETFPCRYAWIPKAVRNFGDGQLFTDEDAAMVRLGVGKNMVRAIKFWADAAGMFDTSSSDAPSLSTLAQRVFAPQGSDPFLEDIVTLWLLHWKISTHSREPLFAWHYMFNLWFQSDFTRTEVLRTFEIEVDRMGRALSAVTLEHHFTTFLHTYVSTARRKGEVLEDNLDCPLVELNLIRRVGDRTSDATGRREVIYEFRLEDKAEISADLFIYCIDDHWRKHHPDERTLSFRQISVSLYSPGQIFKLPEHAIRDRLETIERDSAGTFAYEESAATQRLVRRADTTPEELLSRVYGSGESGSRARK